MELSLSRLESIAKNPEVLRSIAKNPASSLIPNEEAMKWEFSKQLLRPVFGIPLLILKKCFNKNIRITSLDEFVQKNVYLFSDDLAIWRGIISRPC